MRLDELNAKILEGLSGEAKESFLAGLKVLNMANPADREALRESIRKLRPDFTEAQIETFVSGETKPERELDELEESFVRLGLTRRQAKIAARGGVRNLGLTKPVSGGDRANLIASLQLAHPDWTDRHIEIFLNPEGK